MKVSPDYLEDLHRLGAPTGEDYGDPVSKKLSLLVRPAFIAPKNKTLVWGDFSNIEARVLPWLAASPAAERKLDIFRQIDDDPTMPDVYIRTAADLLGTITAEALWAAYKDGDKQAKSWRQSHGKVPELSLGFGGALGALLNMASNYGVYLETQTALDMIARWREANAWAKSFWGAHGRNGSYGLWGACNSAIESPNTIFTAGRVAYVYDPDYLGGTLFCALPCGRLLTYPAIKWEWREVEDKKTGKIEDRYQLTYVKGYGRAALWHGKCAENVTQAAAASILRRTLKRLDRKPYAFMPVVMHTHDEVVTEVNETNWKIAARELRTVMETGEEWDEGLPLKAEITTSWYYSKSVEALEEGMF